MKKIMYGLIIWIVFAAVNAFGSEYPEPTSWVNDYAGVLNSDQQQELDALLKEFENKTTAQIFVAIMDRLPSGTSLEAYVNELFARWKPGQEGKDNGMLLAIFIQDRKLRIEVGYGLEAKLTDAASKLIITNDIAPAFKKGNYYGGIKQGLQSMILTTHESYAFPASVKRPSKAPTPRPQPRRSSGRIRSRNDFPVGFALVIAFVILIVVIKIVKGGALSDGFGDSSWDCSSDGWSSSNDRWSSWDSGRGSSSSGRGSSSSGRGSSSSGGGFSGGGGGSSGGGGASGSW